MLVKLISQKSFLVKIGMLLLLLVLGRGLKEDSQILTAEAQNEVTSTPKTQPPLVLTAENIKSIVPSAEFTSSIN